MEENQKEREFGMLGFAFVLIPSTYVCMYLNLCSGVLKTFFCMIFVRFEIKRVLSSVCMKNAPESDTYVN